MDMDTIRQIVREEIRAQLFDQLAPFRMAINRLVRDIYGENPDGSRADGGGLMEMAKRNNVLLWVVLVLSLVNFFAMGMLTVAVVVANR